MQKHTGRESTMTLKVNKLLFFVLFSAQVGAHELEIIKLLKNDHEIPKYFVQKVLKAYKAHNKRDAYCNHLERRIVAKLDMSKVKNLSYRDAEKAISAKWMANKSRCEKDANDKFNLSILNIILYKKHLFMDYQPELKAFHEAAFPSFDNNLVMIHVRKDVRAYLDKVIGEEPFDYEKTIQNSIMPKQTDINTSASAVPLPKPAQR